MERTAFSRAWHFLDYHPVAKWTALLAAGGTGLLYIALLAALALFTDLLIHRGHIPSLADLPAREQSAFLQGWAKLPLEARKQRLIDAGMPESQAAALAAPDPEKLQVQKDLGVDEAAALERTPGDADALPPAIQESLWRHQVEELLAARVSEQAAALYAEDCQSPYRISRGILSLVVRCRDQRIYGSLAVTLAQWNSWTWRGRGPEGHGANVIYLTGLLVLAVGLTLLRGVLTILMKQAAAAATLEATTRLRRAIYHHTYRLGTLAIRALGPSEAVSMFTRHVEAVHDALYVWLSVMVREPIKFGLLLVFALAVNFWLALAFLFFALLVWFIGGRAAAYYRREGRIASRQAASHLAFLQESLMLMRLVKCYLMEAFNQARVERQLSDYSRAHMRRYLGEAVYRPLLIFLGMLATILLFFLAGLIVLNDRLGVTSSIVLVASLVSLYWPLESWLEHRRYVRRGRESASALFQFLDRPGEVGQVVGAEFLPPLGKQLEFDNVSLREPGTNRLLLRNIKLSITAGEKVAIVGPDDMEKHALVYLIPRFLDPSAGEIRMDEHNLRWVTLDSLRAQIAIVLQHNLVFNDTVGNNIGCGETGFTLPQIIEAAKVAHAHQFIQKLPQGYETPIGEMGHALRISEQFRIALARAILRDPAVLIVEEPPASVLDDDAKALLDDTLARILPGRTALFLPHRVATIRTCNRVFLLNKGQIEAVGDHRELLSQNELYRHLQYLEFNVFAEQT